MRKPFFSAKMTISAMAPQTTISVVPSSPSPANASPTTGRRETLSGSRMALTKAGMAATPTTSRQAPTSIMPASNAPFRRSRGVRRAYSFFSEASIGNHIAVGGNSAPVPFAPLLSSRPDPSPSAAWRFFAASQGTAAMIRRQYLFRHVPCTRRHPQGSGSGRRNMVWRDNVTGA